MESFMPYVPFVVLGLWRRLDRASNEGRVRVIRA